MTRSNEEEGDRIVHVDDRGRSKGPLVSARIACLHPSRSLMTTPEGVTRPSRVSPQGYSEVVRRPWTFSAQHDHYDSAGCKRLRERRHGELHQLALAVQMSGRVSMLSAALYVVIPTLSTDTSPLLSKLIA